MIAIQETHVADEGQLNTRGIIPGYDLLGATFHHTYGVATYIRHTVENASLCSISTEDNIHSVVTQINDITFTNVYKPPTELWPSYVLQCHPHPAVYLGDFNSHHVQWRYASNDDNGESLALWADDHDLHLIFDAKDLPTFRSAAWRREYNPDLCFVSTSDCLPIPACRSVLPTFPHSQHRPIVIELGIKVPIVSTIPQPRWNLRKANWKAYTEQLDKVLGWIAPISENYERFVGAIKSSAKKFIPRGYRKEYIPGWNDISEELYQEFKETGDMETAEQLLHSLDDARRQKWIETVENLDFKHSSRKAWSLLRKLGDGRRLVREVFPVNPNRIASCIVSSSKTPKDRTHTAVIRRELKALKIASNDVSGFACPFVSGEIIRALKDIKPGKAPGFDGIHPEFIIHAGKYTISWLAKFYSNILERGCIPRLMKRTKIIAILKQGKPNKNPESYRPIALLSVVYKLLERLLYNRIGTEILDHIPIEQAGFRPNRSCTDQVLSLTTHIEAGFQNQLKTAVVFVDLTSAYDTVWRQGLIYKLLRIIPCKRIARLIDNMLEDRKFRVILGNKTSRERTLNNGLPQGSVLAPLLFNLYMSDLPKTSSRSFGYADDWAFAVQDKILKNTEDILTADLSNLDQYFRKWRLKPSLSKTVVTCFHLNNKQANYELNVKLRDNKLTYNRYPKYLGVILDRTLSFKEHLKKLSAKLQTRNNILHKLCGTTWGSSASVLRTSALALVFSTAEYCSSVWLNSCHTKMVDSQLNHSMRIISGTIKSTPTFWLPVLSHIPPPHLRRKNAVMRDFKRIFENVMMPIHEDVSNALKNRLQSRNPPVKTATNLGKDFKLKQAWMREWSSFTRCEYRNFPCITKAPKGFDLPRSTWKTLNRIRTCHGRCADSLYKWGKLSSPGCSCGAPKQTINHIVEQCPLSAYQGNISDFQDLNYSCIDYINNMTLKL